MSVTAAEISTMRTDTTTIITALGQSCTVHRSVKNVTTGQFVYGAAHLTASMVIEPASEGLALAQGAPAGSLWRLTAPYQATASLYQRSDLVKAADGRKFVVSGVEPFLTHTVLTATLEDPASYTAV